MARLEVFPVALTGGIEDSKPLPDATDLQELTNFVVFRGRYALRAPISQIGNAITGATKILALGEHFGKLYAVAQHGTTDTRLHEQDVDSPGAWTDRGQIWTWAQTGSANPWPLLASISGGSATTPASRLYVTDYNQSGHTRYWTTGTTWTDVKEDWDDDNDQDLLRFRIIAPYQYHMFGTGQWGAGGGGAGIITRPEIVSYSRPGLIAEAEPNQTYFTSREWWSIDNRPVGRRGESFSAVGYCALGMLLFKPYETYLWFGYDDSSWQARPVSSTIGCVGPYAVASTEEGLCFFWSTRGPAVTDGRTVDTNISESVKRRVLESNASTDTVVGYSPTDGLVYFIYRSSGSTYPDHWLAFDKKTARWSEGEWVISAGTALKVAGAVPVKGTVEPGPAAAPSSLTATAADHETINLSWTNGDTAFGVTTVIERESPVAGGFAVIDTVEAGVTAYEDSGLTDKTQYNYRVKHVRNGQSSSYATASNDWTWMAPPSSISLVRIATGIRVNYTHEGVTGDDVEIQRKGTGDWVSITTELTKTEHTAYQYDDTAVTCNAEYTYRLRTIESGSGRDDSVYSDEYTMRACGHATLLTAIHLLKMDTECDSRTRISWTATGVQYGDSVRITRHWALDGGDVDLGWFDARYSPATDYLEVYGPTGGSTHTLSYTVALYEGGTTLANSITTTTSNEDAEQCLGGYPT